MKNLKESIYQPGCADLVTEEVLSVLSMFTNLALLLGCMQLMRSLLNIFFCRSVNSILWSKEPLRPSPGWILGWGGTAEILPDFEILYAKRQDRIPRKIPRAPRPDQFFMKDSKEEMEMSKQWKFEIKQISRRVRLNNE